MMLACLFLIAFIPFTIKATESSFAKASDFAPLSPRLQSAGKASSDRTADRLPSELPAEVSTPPSITINNNIKPDMLTYKHWTGKYNPDSFKVFVNNTEVSQGNSLQLSSETKTVNLKFDYSFVNGKRTGSKTVSYKLNEDVTQANITFSWDNDNKIIIDNGTAIAS